MAHSFQCPNCSGPIAYEGHGSSVPCPYCGTTVIVPEELRSPSDTSPEAIQVLDLSQIMAEMNAGRKINAIKLYRELTNVGLKEAKDAMERMEATGWDTSQVSEIHVQMTTNVPSQSTPPEVSRPNWSLAIALVVVSLLAIGVMAVLFLNDLDQTIFQPSETTIPSPTPFASSTLTFGSEGTGAGYFKDARSVALDSKGRIFVGDYIPGRIQAFAADGTFLWQTLMPGDTDYVISLAAGLDGKLYAEVGHNIEVFEAETGKLMAKWEPDPQSIGYYDALAVTPRGEVLAVMERELVKFDAQGNLLLHVGGMEEDFLKLVGVSDGSVRIVGMAVDGSGNIYVGTSGNFILKLSADGRLIDRLNGEGDSEKSIYAISIDGQDRIAWGYSTKIVLTDADGRYLGDFEVPFMRDMEFNIKGQLVAVHLSAPLIRVYSFGP
jgi:outer membrane protein assembly factor BamB